MNTYHHKALKQELLAQALIRIAEKGVEDFSLRELAKELQVSHASPYRHFSSKESLVEALTVQGYEKLCGLLQHAVDTVSDASQQLYELGFAYINFFVENRAYFYLMYEHTPLDTMATVLAPYRNQAYQILQSVIKKNVAENYLRPDPLDEMAFGMWAYLHGLVLLWHRQFKTKPQGFERQEVLRYMELFIRGLQ